MDLLRLHIHMFDGDHEVSARVRIGPTKVMKDFTNRLLGRNDFKIPLTLSFDWARANRGAFDREGDGEELAMDP